MKKSGYELLESAKNEKNLSKKIYLLGQAISVFNSQYAKNYQLLSQSWCELAIAFTKNAKLNYHHLAENQKILPFTLVLNPNSLELSTYCFAMALTFNNKNYSAWKALEYCFISGVSLKKLPFEFCLLPFTSNEEYAQYCKRRQLSVKAHFFAKEIHRLYSESPTNYDLLNKNWFDLGVAFSKNATLPDLEEYRKILPDTLDQNSLKLSTYCFAMALNCIEADHQAWDELGNCFKQGALKAHLPNGFNLLDFYTTSKKYAQHCFERSIEIYDKARYSEIPLRHPFINKSYKAPQDKDHDKNPKKRKFEQIAGDSPTDDIKRAKKTATKPHGENTTLLLSIPQHHSSTKQTHSSKADSKFGLDK